MSELDRKFWASYQQVGLIDIHWLLHLKLLLTVQCMLVRPLQLRANVVPYRAKLPPVGRHQAPEGGSSRKTQSEKEK